jgi:hypothetical protein
LGSFRTDGWIAEEREEVESRQVVVFGDEGFWRRLGVVVEETRRG